MMPCARESKNSRWVFFRSLRGRSPCHWLAALCLRCVAAVVIASSPSSRQVAAESASESALGRELLARSKECAELRNDAAAHAARIRQLEALATALEARLDAGVCVRVRVRLPLGRA